jgi:hypothetical protein
VHNLAASGALVHGQARQFLEVLTAGLITGLIAKAVRRGRGPETPVIHCERTWLPGIAVIGLVLLSGYFYSRHPAVRVAAPAVRPAPARTITIRQVITRYVPVRVPVHNWPVSGFELTLLGLGAIAAAVLIVRLAGRYFGR